jgi:hypothetical protein
MAGFKGAGFWKSGTRADRDRVDPGSVIWQAAKAGGAKHFAQLSRI